MTEEGGAVAIVVAIMLTMLIGFVALGVDLASLASQRTELQTKTDLAAMSAAADLAEADSRSNSVIDHNGPRAATVQSLRYARWHANPAVSADERVTMLDDDPTNANAVSVSATAEAPLYFAQVFTGTNSITLNANAMASRTIGASFSLGSRVGRIDDGMLNDLLGTAFGTSLHLDVADYNALADADVGLLGLLQALATEVDFEAGNFVDIVDLTVDAPDLLHALAASLTGSSASVVLGIAMVASEVNLGLSQLIGIPDPDLGLTVEKFLGATEVNALDLLAAVAEIINEGRTVELDAGLTIPGLLHTQVGVRVSERQQESGWVMVGEPRASLHTAQTRLKVDSELEPNLLGPVGIGVSALSLNLPIYAEIGNATATLDTVNCGSSVASDTAVVFEVGNEALEAGGSHVAELFIGNFSAPEFDSAEPLDVAALDYSDFLTVALVIDLPLLPDITISALTLQIRAHTIIGSPTSETVGFTNADLAGAPLAATFGTGNLTTTAVTSLLSSENLSIRVNPDDLSLLGPLVAPVVDALIATLPGVLLSELLTPLDLILNQTLDGLGVGLGEADLTLNARNCSLVQLVR